MLRRGHVPKLVDSPTERHRERQRDREREEKVIQQTDRQIKKEGGGTGRQTNGQS